MFLSEDIERAMRCGRIFYGERYGMAVSAVPLRDSRGELLGIAFLRRISRDFDTVILNRLVDASVDLIAQLLVLVMLFGECRLFAEFLRLRRASCRHGEPPRTRCEAQRTIRIIQNLLPSLFLSFLPTLAREQAQAAGLTAGIYCTLPLVVAFAGDYTFRFLLLERTQRAVRLSCQIGCAACLVASALVILSALCGGYWTLLTAMAVMSLGTALIGCGNTILRGSGLQPDSRYRLLVFTNMEPAIGIGIGVALGAFLYDKIGLAAVGVGGAVFALGMWAVVRLFIHSDIDRRPQTSPRPAVAAGKVLRFVLHPSVLALVLCMVFPVSMLDSFQSYVLPVFGAEQGDSVVLVGFALLAAQIGSLFTLSPALKLIDRLGNRPSMACGMGVLLVVLLVFACLPSLRTILIVIFCYNLLVTVIATCAEREEIVLAEKAGVPFASAARYLMLGEGLAFASGPPIFSGLLTGGYALLGFTLFFALLGLLALFLFAVRR